MTVLHALLFAALSGAPSLVTKAQSPAVAAPRPAATASVRRRAARAAQPGGTALRDVATANRAATIEPAAAGFINAVQVYPYAEGLAYRIYTSPGRVTDVALQAGETLVSVASGDTVRWVIGDTTSGAGDAKRTHVLVKPFTAGLATNLIITTDRRAYHLSLASTAGAAVTAISWSYPKDELLVVKTDTQAAPAKPTVVGPAVVGPAVENLRFDYTISGHRTAWRPLRAFDDGRQTYIEFPASLGVGEAPPLFLIDDKGDAQLVNYRLRGRFYVVDRLFDAAELRLGTKPQRVVRIARTGAVSEGRVR